MIDWVNFTPWASLLGGLLLGLAVAMFILLNGRVLGISGILGGLLQPVFQRASQRPAGDTAWRLTFLAGLLASPWVFGLLAPPDWVKAPRIDAGWAVIVVAGVLVGLGTRLGSGCTSGHGVCGLSRLSLRSLVATLAFMGAGFATVFVVRHVW